jgi:CoA-binding domain
LRYSYVGGMAILFDLVMIVAASVLTGVLYHLAILDYVGQVETFFGIGGLTAVNFSVILAARGAYRPQDLANFWKQVREATTVWWLVFFALSAVAFSLKISESYSRGATLTFFVFGWFVLILWRLIIARFIANALAKGTFAEQKTVLLADKGSSPDPASSRTSSVTATCRCGLSNFRRTWSNRQVPRPNYLSS